MQIFIYEYVTGGGLWSSPGAEPPSGSLLVEGRAMVQAVCEDFSALAGVEVWTTRDARLPALHPPRCRVTVVDRAAAERRALDRLAFAADWTLLIAPETDGALMRRAHRVEAIGGRLLSPPSELIAIAADKQATAEQLAKRGVPVPTGVALCPGDPPPVNVRFPAVLKPLDGCGSQDVRLLQNAAELRAAAIARPMRVEEYIPGQAASAAVLCGPSGSYPLPACTQRLTNDGHFAYLGGRLPLPAELDARARRLARAAIAALPLAHGYIGVDLVLGEASDGGGDRVIEINPRLTTAYVGLRAAAGASLAAAMLDIAAGRAPDLRFGSQPVEFAADGTSRLCSSSTRSARG